MKSLIKYVTIYLTIKSCYNSCKGCLKDNNLAESLENFLSISKFEKETLLTKQRARLADFSWKKSAERLAEIYNSI